MKLKFRPLFAIFALTISIASQAQKPAEWVNNLSWNLVGPARGGRSIACTGVKGKPNEFYFGATGGGLWKTTNQGKNWTCVSDGFFKSSSVGAVAVSESNTDVVYAGMGERDIRGNCIEGDGVYKSTDGGKTWNHVGLKECRVISRIVIDPKNPEVVYVAALGKIFGSNSERGIYKSGDGGKSWKKVLYVSDTAGGNDLMLDPTDPNTVYASTWECYRKPWEMSSGGPGSKLWKSKDGGATWTDLSSNPGLPISTLGKICIAMTAAKPGRIWAMVEAKEGGLFRSEDGGATWKRINADANIRQRPWYFSKIAADPKNENVVYALNVGAYKSSDGGSKFNGFRTGHSDNHDIWISPDDSNLMVEANDGGGQVTTDGAKTWSELKIPTAQFYHVFIDNQEPYQNILGAQQDNSTVRYNLTPGPADRAWTSSAGGESGYMAAFPDDPDMVLGGNYGGTLELQNHRTNSSKALNPWPDEPIGHGAEDARYRFQWTYPILFSPHNKKKLYVCSQHVMASTDLGMTWQILSPDLTRHEPHTLKPSGGPITKDNTGVEVYGTVFTFAESPKVEGLFWAGSDDGLVHVSRDGGKNWEQITPNGLPKFARCSMIEPSPFEPGTAYLAANAYQLDDTAVYIYRTRDFGKNWQLITKGITPDSYARVVRADPEAKGVLYAGTETGVWVSFDEGDNWQPLGKGLPLTPVHDIAIKNNLMVVATHGRSFWRFDDLQNIRAMANTDAKTPFAISKANSPYWSNGTLRFAGYNTSDVKSIKTELLDMRGQVLRTDTQDAPQGWKTYRVGMNHSLVRPPQNLILWNFPPSSVRFAPGKYRLRVTAGKQVFEQTVNLRTDPGERGNSDADWQEQIRFSKEVAGTVNRVFESLSQIRNFRGASEKLTQNEKATPAQKAMAKALLEKLSVYEARLHQTKAKSGQDVLNFPVRLDDKLCSVLNAVVGADRRPAQFYYDIYAYLSKDALAQVASVDALFATELVELNKSLKATGLPEINKNQAGTSTNTIENDGDDEDEKPRNRKDHEEGGGDKR